ncbi:hypothetical protein EC973_002635 [Apophysomyces ossiformis]|uniref:Glycosyltransferase 61 catalytic domain-containing protein n=1 Tax=Apophysomyces ossiformis TaxID=679940 RepID=A0A8H7BMF7_9FUNG|nr:hypothetical protein EC973_002635 [Apophysomyces ossiformis]
MFRSRRRLQTLVWLFALNVVVILSYISYTRYTVDSWLEDLPFKSVYPDQQLVSSWKCSGSDRSKTCEISNFCIDGNSGGFIVVNNPDTNIEELSVNLMNADEEEDHYYLPKKKAIQDMPSDVSVRFLNESVFVYGLYHPEHFAHMLFNGLMGLYRSMKQHDGTNKSWTYRAYQTVLPEKRSPLITTEFMTHGKDIVLDKRSITTNQQVLAPRTPICFSRAIVGSGAACSLGYCEQAIENDIYASFRKDALSYYVNDDWSSNAMLDSDEKGLACVRSIRFSNTLQGNDTHRTIAIINRQSRHITNIESLLHALAASSRISGLNYKIKHIDFDHGCSLGSTAYLLHDVDILLTPHGSQEAAAIFMKDNSVVISIDGRGYSEPWFAFVMTAMGRRFYKFQACWT